MKIKQALLNMSLYGHKARSKHSYHCCYVASWLRRWWFIPDLSHWASSLSFQKYPVTAKKSKNLWNQGWNEITFHKNKSAKKCNLMRQWLIGSKAKIKLFKKKFWIEQPRTSQRSDEFFLKIIDYFSILQHCAPLRPVRISQYWKRPHFSGSDYISKYL